MKNVFFLGLVSFFSDVSSEMVYPLIPLYLTAAFGATPLLIGFIEGIAESLASLLKVFSGYLSDRLGKKKPLAFCGYATGLVYKLALLFATSWVGILGARVIDRLGKGIRTAPRDVMVSESARAGGLGAAFGVHKALDMAGSALGILLSFLLLKLAGGALGYRSIFALSMLPVVLSLCMFLFVKEGTARPEPVKREPFWKNWKKLNGQLKLYLAVVFLFTLGNSSNSFLLLRAKDVGFGDTDTILLYFLYNLTASLLTIPMGRRSDKVGRKSLLVAGYVAFSLVYFGFAGLHSKGAIAAVFVLYGVYTALTAGVERAFVAEISPPELKGTMLGLQSALVGVALLPASALAGLLWNSFGPSAPFLFGGGLSLLAALLLGLFLKGGAPKAA